MTRVSASPDGLATDQMRRYYGAFARGGFAAIITEGTYTDQDASPGYDNQPGIATPAQAEAWRAVTDEIHAHGAVAILQLMHAGALSQRTGGRTVAPSAVRPRGQMMPDYGGSGSFPIPEALSDLQISTIVNGFVESAIRAVHAGFDGVEIHGANGYLLDQFTTPYTNLRTDRYGGSAENRIRLTAEIVERVREATPKGFIVGVRLSEAKVNDFQHRWEEGEAPVIFRAVAAAGASYIHIAGEGRGFRDALDAGTKPLTTLARELTGVPVIANGGLHDVELADRVIDEGHADLIAVGRAALANPDWPRRVARGRSVVDFDHGMISPQATIDNTRAWFETSNVGQTCGA
jgi:2,4-dienoyl-CoA reductase-like NADH-dependent reductase (Old Yellow Enzyme family)